jgi:hypothetical protein
VIGNLVAPGQETTHNPGALAPLSLLVTFGKELRYSAAKLGKDRFTGQLVIRGQSRWLTVDTVDIHDLRLEFTLTLRSTNSPSTSSKRTASGMVSKSSGVTIFLGAVVLILDQLRRALATLGSRYI